MITLTIFEKLLINDTLGSVKHAPISELEIILDMRKKFKPTDKEINLDKEGNPAIHSKKTEFEITALEKKIIYRAMANPEIGLPVKEETRQLIQKLKPNGDNK